MRDIEQTRIDRGRPELAQRNVGAHTDPRLAAAWLVTA
jgi:hypothetical protein